MSKATTPMWMRNAQARAALIEYAVQRRDATVRALPALTGDAAVDRPREAEKDRINAAFVAEADRLMGRR